jgi:signal transduction histidine kinase
MPSASAGRSARRPVADRLDRRLILGHLAAGLCHELAQPLASLSSLLFAAQTIVRNSPGIDARLRESLAGAIKQLERASQITHGIRHMIQHGTPARTAFDFNRAVQRGVDSVRADRDLPFPIELRLAPDAPLVIGDPVLAQQIIINLLHNALRAGDRTGRVDRRIEIETAADLSGEVRCAVHDNGAGFGRGNELGRSSDVRCGLGVGLDFCRAVVEAGGGRMWMENRAGGGATVSFTLPAADGAHHGT